MTPVRGLVAWVYKHCGASYSNGGLSSAVDEVTIVGVAGEHGDVQPVFGGARVFEPTAKAPPVVLVFRHLGGGVVPQAVPAVVGDDGSIERVRVDGAVGPMAGGCYIDTSDGRLRELVGFACGPIALHDRFETREHYASYD